MLDLSSFVLLCVFIVIGITIISCFLILHGGIVRFRGKELFGVVPFVKQKIEEVHPNEVEFPEEESFDVKEFIEEEREKEREKEEKNKNNRGRKGYIQ